MRLVGGRFLMGDQGYGAFETTLYEDKVENLVAWPSHGHVIEMEDRLISIQMSNDLSVPQFLVGLEEGGKVSPLSQRLGGYYTSTPQLMADGNIYFWRADAVWAWNPKDGLRSVFHAGFGEGSFASTLKFDERRLAFNIHRAYGHSHNQRMFVVLSL